MTRSKYNFRIGEAATMPSVEETLLMSVIAIEGIHGRARVRMDARFNVDHDRRICTVNSDNRVGEDLARVLSEFLLLEFGDEAFQVEETNGHGCRRESAGRCRR